MKLTVPSQEEYAPSYADYVQRAAKRADVYEALELQIGEIHSTLDTLNDAQACSKPGPREWSIKGVTGHLGDVERVFSYRLFRIARNDGTPLASFDQDDYVQEAGFDHSPLEDLISEFEYQRRANILAIHRLSDEFMDRRGTASGCAVSARALIYMLVGHVEHHMASLREKYLPTDPSL